MVMEAVGAANIVVKRVVLESLSEEAAALFRHWEQEVISVIAPAFFSGRGGQYFTTEGCCDGASRLYHSEGGRMI